MKGRWLCLALLVGMLVAEPLAAQRFRFRLFGRRRFAPVPETPAPAAAPSSPASPALQQARADAPPSYPSVNPARAGAGSVDPRGNGASPLGIRGRPAPASEGLRFGAGDGSAHPGTGIQRTVPASTGKPLPPKGQGGGPAGTPPPEAGSRRPASAGAAAGLLLYGAGPAQAPTFRPAISGATQGPGANGAFPNASPRRSSAGSDR
jgi:hypothetical protein